MSIIERYRDLLLRRGAPDAAAIDVLLTGLNEQHRWADIDYADQRRTNWQPSTHPSRIRTLARAWAGEADPQSARAVQLQTAINHTLRSWVQTGPQSPNWWHNEIGVPNDLLAAVVLARPAIDEKLQQAVTDEVLGRQLQHGGTHTGQNLIWRARHQLIAAALAGNDARAKEAADRIAGEIIITTGEGVQPDFSFHQHGAQLYNGGYGASFAQDTPVLAYILHGSPHAFSEEKINIIVEFLLEGQQWMMHGPMISESTTGRGIARVEDEYPVKRGGYIRSAELMAELVPDRAEALRVFARRQQADADPPAPPLVGAKHFYRSDFTVHHRPDWDLTIKSVSNRLRRTESGNGENLKGTHLDDGLTFLVRGGDEYRALQPVWDWKKLPGTTAVQDDHLPIWNWSAPKGETAFVGGATDGRYALAAYDFVRSFEGYTVAGRKAWFMFDGQFVALGAGIRSDAEASVVTTIEQNHLSGKVKYLRADRKAMEQAVGLDEPTEVGQFIEHDGVQYEVLDGRPMLVARKQTGTWQSINQPYSDRLIEHEVFTLWIDHGTEPTDGSYAYRVTIDAALQRADVRQHFAPAVVLSNTAALQAVAQPKRGITQAAFYEAGTLAGDDERPTITVDQPCLVMLHGKQLTVADPAHALTQVTVTVGERSHTIDLPVEGHAGRSVTIDVE